MKDFNFDEHINHLSDLLDQIKINEVTVLTGDNATGKSLIRKSVWSRVNKQLGIKERKSFVSDISMERRTGCHDALGGAGAFLRDVSWTPTSMETFNFLRGILQNLKEDIKGRQRYIVLDEPELGASREVQKAFGKYINQYYDKVHDINKCYGLLVITHSEELVKELKFDNFLNIQGLTREEWLDRPIKDIDLNELREFSSNLFLAVEKRLK